MLPDVSKKRVLFVGERIRDVYHYGRLIGRPPKEPVICIEHQGHQVFQGGVVAASEHAKSFVEAVDVFSTKEISKERFVESNRYRKLFEVYSGTTDIDAKWPDLPSYDAVIVTDYGHGMMTQAVIDKIYEESAFLAVNVQTNSGNYGFNLATKYPRVDYLCVAETEARLATQNQFGAIEDSVRKLGDISSRVVVTVGKNGAFGWDGELHYCQAFNNRVVDTMGAGDAFFAITACFASSLSMDDLLKVGNAAGSLKAQALGQKPVTKDELRTYLAR